MACVDSVDSGDSGSLLLFLIIFARYSVDRIRVVSTVMDLGLVLVVSIEAQRWRQDAFGIWDPGCCSIWLDFDDAVEHRRKLVALSNSFTALYRRHPPQGSGHRELTSSISFSEEEGVVQRASR